ncbi:unnamed protein product [Sphagnum balticum]
MEVSCNGNSATNSTSYNLPSSNCWRKRNQGCNVAMDRLAVAPANGENSIQRSSKRIRVANLEGLDSMKPTCLQTRCTKRVFVRGKLSSRSKVCLLPWRNAIAEEWSALENVEEFTDAKAKLIKGLGLFDSVLNIPGTYEDAVLNGQGHQQAIETQEQLIRQSQGDADVQFAWPPLENEEEFAHVKTKFIEGLGLFGSEALVTGIYRDSSPKGQARQQAFERQAQLARETRGDANVQYAWHGTSKRGLSGIILHGFGQPRRPKNGSAYGVGVYLAPENHADVSAMYADNDENEEQHMLLCQVILGAAELVLQGSDQFCPSSEHFDTGADDLSAPKRLIVWSTHMNTHILPLYVVRFKLSLKWHGPTSPCVSFPYLFVLLRQQLAPENLCFLEQQYAAFKAGRLQREQLIKVCRDVAGDSQLVNAIQQLYKCQKAKELELLKIKYRTFLHPVAETFA